MTHIAEDARHTLEAGRAAIATQGLRAALVLLQSALAAAEADPARDPGLLYDALREYGFYVAGVDLPRSRTLLLRAHAWFAAAVLPTLDAAERPQRIRDQADLGGRIGIITFDHGEYGQSLHWLEAALADLGADPGPIANYLAQVYTAIGRFDAAEALLLPARRAEPVTDALLYDRSLLGKLYIEAGRWDEAAALLPAAWEAALATRVTWMLTLVGNYYADLLLCADAPSWDPAQALAVALTVESYAVRDGWNRSAIVAMMNRARALHALGHTIEAAAISRAAVAFLGSFGLLPAVRMEEIWFHHARIAAATDAREEADRAVTQARSIALAKIASLTDPADQAALRTVPIIRQILAG